MRAEEQISNDEENSIFRSLKGISASLSVTAALAVCLIIYKYGSIHPAPPVELGWLVATIFLVSLPSFWAIRTLNWLEKRLKSRFARIEERISAQSAGYRSQIVVLEAARQAAETANDQKSDFLATVSHEIRTPLNGVMAMAEIMAANDLGEAQRERLQVIRQSGVAVIELLDDVLDLAQIESGRLTFEPQAFNPARLAEDAAAAFRPLAASRGLMLQVRTSSDAERFRIGDPARIRQVLSNLIANSLKFTPAGRIKVTVDVSGDDLVLRVADTGIGIPQERMTEVFQKFATSKAPSSGLRDGAGLGLAICKDICELMGGRIWLESDRTVGTAFNVSLPLALAPANCGASGQLQEATPLPKIQADNMAVPDALEPLETEAPGQLRVLAAEDNTTNRLVLEAMIGILGLDLDVVGDGREAIDAWETSDYDLILMDIQMPVMDGIQATREIRRRELATGRKRTPIVAVSANVMTHQVAEYIAAGMDDHVPKPIQLARLHRAIVAAVNSQSEIEETEEFVSKTQNGHPD